MYFAPLLIILHGSKINNEIEIDERYWLELLTNVTKAYKAKKLLKKMRRAETVIICVFL